MFSTGEVTDRGGKCPVQRSDEDVGGSDGDKRGAGVLEWLDLLHWAPRDDAVLQKRGGGRNGTYHHGAFRIFACHSAALSCASGRHNGIPPVVFRFDPVGDALP